MELTTPRIVFQVCFCTALWRFLYIVMTNRNKARPQPFRVAEESLFA
jgi:hypothetical protein